MDTGILAQNTWVCYLQISMRHYRLLVSSVPWHWKQQIFRHSQFLGFASSKQVLIWRDGADLIFLAQTHKGLDRCHANIKLFSYGG